MSLKVRNDIASCGLEGDVQSDVYLIIKVSMNDWRCRSGQ